MNKIKITFSISQKLSGHIKNVCVIARSVDQCWEKIHRIANDYKTFSVKVLNIQKVDENYPSGIMEADSQVVISYRGAASIIPGAAIHGNLEQRQISK